MATRIKKCREMMGLSREELADRLGVTYFTVRRYEMEEYKPPTEQLEKLADLFQVSTDYLLGRNGDEAA